MTLKTLRYVLEESPLFNIFLASEKNITNKRKGQIPQVRIQDCQLNKFQVLSAYI